MNIPRSLLLLLLTTFSGVCFAQAVPDAGTLERDIQQHTVQEPVGDSPVITLPDTEKPSKKSGGVKLFVRAFQFEGNTLFSKKELDHVLAPYLNQQLNFSQINAAVRAIAAYYRQSGRLARTSLPKQDVTEGVITIRIVEARFGGAFITDPSAATRIDPNVLSHDINAALPLNRLINVDELERSILLANDLPGVNVSGALRAGERAAETALHLSLSDEALFAGEAGINNSGSRTTGSERLWANFRLNSPSKRGDLLTSSLSYSEGSDYIQMNYSLPVALPGLRVGASAAYMSYELISDEFKALAARGDFKSVGINASYPLIRSQKQNLSLMLDFVRKQYSNESLSTTQSSYSINGFSLGLSGNMPDGIKGGGINSANISWRLGDVKLNALEAGEDAALEGSFNKLTFGASRLQFIADNTDLLTLFTAQLADQHLDSSERFYLGGANDVRAYPNSEVSGSQGWRTSVELRRRLPKHFQLAGFYDMGRAYNKNSSPDYGLKGIGVKVNWHHVNGLKAEAVWSRRIGSNPNPTATGSDQDGSLKKNRLWLSLSWKF